MKKQDLLARRPFTTWLIIECLALTIGFWCWHAGLIHKVYEVDSTKITFGILVLAFLVTLRVGALAYRVETEVWINDIKDTIRKRMAVPWFFSQYCFSLGLIGTVIGLIGMLLIAFDGKATADAAAAAALLPVIGSKYATALFATASGLVGGCIIQLQAFVVDYALSSTDES